MSVAPKPRTLFGHRLRVELDRSGTSMRELARRLNPESSESARRNLLRWISGSNVASRRNRRACAVALGLDPSYFDDDDEESDPLRQLDLNEFLLWAVSEYRRKRVAA